MIDETNDDFAEDRREQREAAFERGREWAARYEAELEKQLEWNIDREQQSGEKNRFDFYANDDDGKHQFSIEIKYRQDPEEGKKAYWTGDKRQEEGLVLKTKDECDQKTMFYMVPERFIDSPRLAERKEDAKKEGVELIMLPLEQVEENIRLIKEELDRVIDEKARADAINDREPEMDRAIDNDKDAAPDPRLQDSTADGAFSQFETSHESTQEAENAARDGNDTTAEKDVEATDTAPLAADDQDLNDPVQDKPQDGSHDEPRDEPQDGSPDEAEGGDSRPVPPADQDLADLDDKAETDLEAGDSIDDTAIETGAAVENVTNSEEILAGDSDVKLDADGGEEVGDLDRGSGPDDLGGDADESRLVDFGSGEADFTDNVEPGTEIDGAGSSDVSVGIDIGPGMGKDD